MRSITRAASRLVLVACATLTPARVGQTAGKSPAPRDVAQLAATTLKAHRGDGLLVIAEPTFSVTAKKLQAYPGAIRARDELLKTLELSDREQALFQCHLRLQLLSTYFQSADDGLARHWRPYLDEAGRVVLNEKPGTDDCGAQIDQILALATNAYANKHGLAVDAATIRGTLVKVSFAAEPPNGSLLLVDGLTYRLAGRTIEKEDWLHVGATDIALPVGDYRVKGSWDGGRSWQVQPLVIREKGRITVRKE